MANKHGYASNDWMKVEVGQPEWGSTGPDIAYLPHQCDNWEIGDADDVRALIKDLQAALEKLEADDGAV
jgi:hypothetical protein